MKVLSLPLTALATTTLATAMSLAAAAQQIPTDGQRIEQLENQVRALQQKAVAPSVERVRLNGFLSVGLGKADNDAGYAGYTEDYDLEQESLLGLQGTFTISPSTEVIMQLVGRGDDQWDPEMEWAYIGHRFTGNFKARAGKMRIPLFMYSDSLEVGYSQPWARPPYEIYGVPPFASYTGADAFYDWNLGSSNLTAQGFAGQSTVPTELKGLGSVDLKVRDMFGASLTWTDFVWTTRAIYSGASFTIPGVLEEETDVTFYGVGGGFNNGSWQVLTEITRVEIDSVTADPQSAYVTVAKRFGALTPYISYAIVETQDNDERPLTAAQAFALVGTPGSPYFGNTGILLASDLYNVERKATSLGVRWDALTNVALKFDVTFVDGFGGTGGGLPGNLAPTIAYEDAMLYTIKLDAIF